MRTLLLALIVALTTVACVDQPDDEQERKTATSDDPDSNDENENQDPNPDQDDEGKPIGCLRDSADCGGK